MGWFRFSVVAGVLAAANAAGAAGARSPRSWPCLPSDAVRGGPPRVACFPSATVSHRRGDGVPSSSPVAAVVVRQGLVSPPIVDMPQLLLGHEQERAHPEESAARSTLAHASPVPAAWL